MVLEMGGKKPCSCCFVGCCFQDLFIITYKILLQLALQTVSEVSKRKSTLSAKLKAASQEERIQMWKEHFKNLLGNSPKITHNPITKIIDKQLDNKLGQFTQEELNGVQGKIKSREVASLEELPRDV